MSVITPHIPSRSASVAALMASRSANSADGTTSSSGSDSSLSTAAGGAMGKDQFVKLLVTEMQNQDPLNPMDGKELAVQLAQFSSVEQLMNVNTKLDTLTQAIRTQFTATN